MVNNPIQSTEIKVAAGDVILNGNLHVPSAAKAIVLFVHGSGSSRFSPRNQYVANALNQRGLVTLLFDLLTEEEGAIDEITRELRFNIPLLAQRLIATTDWVTQQEKLKSFNIGYFGASTGAAAALIGAAQRPKLIKAVVSRGGRPDLANHFLAEVKAPTLLIVGGWDDVVIELNQEAKAKMRCEVAMKIVPGATHLFEEPGKMEEVIKLAGEWFEKLVPHSYTECGT